MKAGGRVGFTIIELLVVVLVIGILAAIAVPKLYYAREKAYKNGMMADLRNLSTLQETYHLDNFQYSDDLDLLGMVASRAVTIEINEAGPGGWGAVATHESVDSGSCGIYYGSADPSSGAPATSPGVVYCDFGG